MRGEHLRVARRAARLRYELHLIGDRVLSKMDGSKRMNKLLSRLGMGLGLVALAACTGHGPGPQRTVSLSKQSQCPLPLAVGQNVDLKLPSLPTSGFRWKVVDAAPAVLQSLGPEVYTDPEDAGLVGGNGQSLWRFKAIAAGEAHLKLVSQQPWAPEVKPVEAFDCTLSVK